MAELLECVETWEGRTSEWPGDFRSQDLLETKRYGKSFRLVVDDAALTPTQLYDLATAVTNPGPDTFPLRYDPYPDDPFYQAKRFTFKAPDKISPNFIDVDIGYELFYNPLLEPPEIELSFNQWERAIEAAYDPPPESLRAALAAQGLLPPRLPDGSLAIVNSALDIFDQVPTRQEPYRILRVAHNRANQIEFDVMTNYVLRINSADFIVKFIADGTTVSYPAGTVLLDEPPSMTQHDQSGIRYFRYVWNFKVRVQDPFWLLRIPDFGFRTANPDWSEQFNILDLNGQPTQIPRKLNGVGGLATPRSALVYLDYVQYFGADFNNLGLMSNIP